jgi:putative membrane protein
MLMGLGLATVLTTAMAQDTPKSAQERQNSTQDTAQSTSTTKSQLNMADRKFVKDAAQGGMAEVELGQLAAEKASSEDVKKFGQRMVDDHSKANDNLKELATKKGVHVPQQLSAKDKAIKARLTKLSGDQFDKAYMANMVRDHKKDVAESKRETESAKDPDIKNFATSTLPTLEDHLKQAQSLAPGKSERSSAQMPKPSQH